MWVKQDSKFSPNRKRRIVLCVDNVLFMGFYSTINSRRSTASRFELCTISFTNKVEAFKSMDLKAFCLLIHYADITNHLFSENIGFEYR